MKHHQQSEFVWDEIRNPDCTSCGLHEHAKTVCVLGDGPVPCDGMIIGEAPGFSEDETGIPFSGKSGIFLRKMLKSVGIDPRTIYITNTVACRPPGNRTPTRKEINTCSRKYLVREIDKVKPKALLLLGNVAVSFAKGRKAAVTKIEGSTFKLDQKVLEGLVQFYDITCVPSRHPSSVVRAEEEDGYLFLVQKFRENMLLFKRTLHPVKDEFKFSQAPVTVESFELGKPLYTDCETDGLSPFRDNAKIHSLGFAQDPKKIYCFSSGNTTPVREILKHYAIMAHRGTFEGTWFRRVYGITPRIYYDTKLGAYMRDENEPSGLKYQAIKNLKVDPWSEELDPEHPDLKTLLPYNARDISYGLRLYQEIDLPFIKHNPKIGRLMKYILLPAMEVFTDIICNGYHIDAAQAEKKLEICATEQKKLNNKLSKVAGWKVNPGSPKQMSRLFYDQLGLVCPVKTAKGKNSTAEASLIRLRGQHPATDILWDWRGWDKKRSTYLEPWLRQGPILHANYGFYDTDTGRLNSSMVKNKRGEKKTGAVLHQCPRDGFIRNLVTPRGYSPFRNGRWHHDPPPESQRHPEDWCIVAGDCSQVELRLVAHAANETTMIEVFNHDPHTPEGDIHLTTAMEVMKQPADRITKEIRKRAKAVNFGFVYGMWAKKFVAYALEKFDLTLSLKEGYQYRKEFFRKYAGLEPWHKRVEAFVRNCGFIDSIFGRRRHLPVAKTRSDEDDELCPTCDPSNLQDDCFHCGGTGYITMGPDPDEWVVNEAVRQAINSPIQSAASDITLLIASLIASLSMPWKFKMDREKCFGIGSAHDSLLFECRRDYVKEFKEGVLWTVKQLVRVIKKLFGVELRAPIFMDLAAYSDCWEGKELTV